MKRVAFYFLNRWIDRPHRRPLLLKGARHVGKTWLVRHFAKNKHLVEINFERNPDLASLFEGNNPSKILQNLSVFMGKTVDPLTSILFLDEIHEAPEILSKLRWFYEECPDIPIIATSSLLEFALEQNTLHFPVGQIAHLRLEPLSFEEFLWAQKKDFFYEYLQNVSFPFDIPIALHKALSELFQDYLRVGGMPSAVLSWCEEKSWEHGGQIHHDLLASFRDDFFKYKGRLDVKKMDAVLRSIPKQIGRKFVYSKALPATQAHTVQQIVSLLNKALLCHPVKGSSGNGVPLSAEIREKSLKEIFLDIGLMRSLFGGVEASHLWGKQVVGQILRTTPSCDAAALYTWHREEPGSSAEIDYLIEVCDRVVPVEVKSGRPGTLKSLHLFMESKKLRTALRIHTEPPSVMFGSTYTLLSIPFYLTGQARRLIEESLRPGFV